MSPSTVVLITRLLDIAVLAGSAYVRHRDGHAEVDVHLADLRALRERVLLGELDEGALVARLDELVAGLQDRRRQALARLPAPRHPGGARPDPIARPAPQRGKA